MLPKVSSILLEPETGATDDQATIAELLSNIIANGQVAFYYVITPDTIRTFLVTDKDLDRMHPQLNETLSKWQVNKTKFQVSLPKIDSEEVSTVTYRATGTYAWDYILGQTGSGLDDTSRTPPAINTVLDTITDAGQTAVYRVALTDEDFSDDRKAYKSKLDDNSPNLLGKLHRIVVANMEAEADVGTHNSYDSVLDKLEERDSKDIGLNAELYVAGEGAANTARALESAFETVGNNFYETVGETTSIAQEDIHAMPHPEVKRNLPRRTPGIKRLLSNTSPSIIASPHGAIEYCLPAVDRLSDRTQQMITTERSSSP